MPHNNFQTSDEINAILEAGDYDTTGNPPSREDIFSAVRDINVRLTRWDVAYAYFEGSTQALSKLRRRLHPDEVRVLSKNRREYWWD